MGIGIKPKFLFFIPGTMFFLLVLLFFLIGYAIPYWILLVCSFLIGLILWFIAEKRKAAETSEKNVLEKDERTWKNKLNLGKYAKILFYVAIAAIVLYFLLPYFMNADTSKEQKAGPLNSVIYVESQEGAGIVVNNGTYGIQLATGSSTVGTTFILSTIRNETGWPSFGADIYSPKGGATLKVTYIDLDNPKKNIRFKKIEIPAEYRFRYANKYKLSDYRASISKGNTEELPDKGQTAYRIDPMNHDIKVEVYVPPNSYVELSNVAIIRNW